MVEGYKTALFYEVVLFYTTSIYTRYQIILGPCYWVV